MAFINDMKHKLPVHSFVHFPNADLPEFPCKAPVRPVRFLVAEKYNPKKGIFSCAPVCACQMSYVTLDKTCAFVSVKSQSIC